VARALGAIKPVAVLLMEAEVWPNFLWRARNLDIPVFLVNARLSERSYRWYRRLGWFFRPLFESFAGVGAQNEADAARLRELGCRPEVIRVVGSLKFDAAQLEERTTLDVPALLRQVGVEPDRRILLGGSTHAGEEAVLAEMFQRLRTRHPDLFLVLVPRHFERGREVGETLARLGVRFVYRSEITSRTSLAPGQVDCLLVNTTGELRHFYPHATVVFVGKSLTAEGGQNPLEPAAVGRPVVFGPHMENFAEIAGKLVSGGGAWQVTSAAELETAVDRLLGDPQLREQMGRRAVEVVRENLGAVERTVEMVLEVLQRRRPEVLIVRE
jgi:3-deoxy-D-manno-octulosonic-acid transferase